LTYRIVKTRKKRNTFLCQRVKTEVLVFSFFLFHFRTVVDRYVIIGTLWLG